MKGVRFLIPLLILLPWISPAQRHDPVIDSLSLLYKSGLYNPLSYYDSVYVNSLPVLDLPANYQGRDAPVLPPVVDNSTQPFMRPVFNQAGYSCGQASLVGYNFTYELNYVRNTSADDPENQHPTHFTWNWMNAGNYYGGVSYYHSMEVLRHVGDPTVDDYGGMSYGGEKRWMSGYDLYYNAMHNRIRDLYNIRTGTYEGFLTLKHWLHTHLENATAGGVASFYANQPTTYYLPPGTPEAGKHVCIAWGSSASHALCIVGYNDSICWDYNSDGQYTNHLDINGDGKVTMKDWEIGGFKFVNSYGGVPNWGDSGYCYMMYKTVAESFGQGGIWNNMVNVLKPKTNCDPQLTMKVNMTYTCRNQLKITAGVSSNINATVPTYVMGFPVFNFQGGCLYMQGGTSESDKTIEFGLDVTPLLNYLQPGQQAKFFLQVEEKDPNGWGDGQINAFSLMDYTAGVTEIPCGQSNVPIQNNTTTRLSVIATVNYSDVTIQTPSLPPATLYEPYTYNLAANGGTPPYEWSLRVEYQETAEAVTFPNITAEQLTPTNNTTGYAMKVLPFEFPFYGNLFDTVYMYVNGYIKFDNFLVTFPYHQDNYLRFLKNRNIAPMFDFLLRRYPEYGDGLWYQGDTSGATFRWKVSQDGVPSSSEINLALKLFPSGKIEIYYGTSNVNYTTEWFAGATKGDAKNYHIPGISGINPIPQNTRIRLQPNPYPMDMAMDDAGNFHGTPGHVCQQLPVTFMATDLNNIASKKTLAFTTTGIKSTFTVHAGMDDLIEPGDTVSLDVVLQNLSPDPYTGAMMKLTTSDTLVMITDSVQYLGTLSSGQILQVPDAFQFTVSDNMMDGHTIAMNHTIIAVEDTLNRSLSFTAYAPIIIPGMLIVDDDQNGQLDPGETTDLLFFIENTGGGKASHLCADFSSVDPFITVNQSTDTIQSLQPHSDTSFLFNISVSPEAPYGHIAYFTITLEGDQGIGFTDSLYIVVGTIYEDFETGDFSKFDWYSGGHQSWFVTEGVSFEGDFSARSGNINHSQQSSLLLEADVLTTAPISFYSRVSSEYNYDWLFFYIDGVEQSRWSGEVGWAQHSYIVIPGYHTFKWTYHKDANTVAGSDCAWIDYVVFPPLESLLITVYAGTDDTICQDNICQLNGIVYNVTSIEWATSGSGSFDDPGIINPLYTPGATDISSGSAVLTMTGVNDQDQELSDQMELSIRRFPYPNAGVDRLTCESDPVMIDAEITFSDSTFWTTTGDGSFNDPYLLDVVYTPGTGDVTDGSVYLILTAYPLAPCTESRSDTMLLTIQYNPQAFAGNDGSGCENEPYPLNGTVQNAGFILWSTLGDGTFDDPGLLNAMYTPGQGDIALGTAQLILTAFGLTPCTTTDSDTLVLTLMPPPVTNAGDDQTIPYNTSTTLYGSAGGGSGVYSYHWEPEIFLLEPDVQNPHTIPLTSSVTFTLTVTDNVTTCSGTDTMVVFIEGAPFYLSVTADPNPVCTGTMVQLYAGVEGNTGPYTFFWSSDPPGFTSGLQDPTDIPLVTTTYYVEVTDDLENVIQDYITVTTVDPPTAFAGEDTTICYGYPFVTQGQAAHYSYIRWHTFGDGSFDDSTSLNAVYTAGPTDLDFGNALLQLTVTGNPPCDIPASDMMLLSFLPQTLVTFGELPALCIDDPPLQLTGGDPPGGTYSGIGVINGYFYPSIAGIGVFTITYSYTDNNDCTFSVDQTIVVDECTGMASGETAPFVQVIPNPNRGLFEIMVNAPAEDTYTFSFQTVTGHTLLIETIHLQAGSQIVRISFGQLHPGLYLLSVRNCEMQVQRKVVIY